MNAVDGWKTETLGNQVELIRNGYSGQQVDRFTDFPVSRIETISDGTVNTKKVGYVDFAPESYLLKAGDLLLSNINSLKHIGKVAQVGEGVRLFHGMNLLVLRPVEQVDRRFLFYKLINAKQWFEKMAAQAINQASINQVTIRQLQLDLPRKKSEQTEIAEILSTVDRAIEQTEALIAKQQRIKAGLMQDLLTRGIDDHGNIRSERTHKFKESPLGRIPEEWEVKNVYETGDITIGRQLAPKYVAGKFPTPYLRVANVFDGWIDFDDVLEMDFTPREKEKYFLRAGDILLNEGQSIELVGRSSIFPGPDNFFCFQNTLIRYRAFEDTLPTYARAVFKWWLDKGVFRDIARQTTSVAHLGADRFAQMFFPYPPFKEQDRIVETILAHESQLQTEQNVRAKLLSLKAGLMQDLLTGKKRVTALLRGTGVPGP